MRARRTRLVDDAWLDSLTLLGEAARTAKRVLELAERNSEDMPVPTVPALFLDMVTSARRMWLEALLDGRGHGETGVEVCGDQLRRPGGSPVRRPQHDPAHASTGAVSGKSLLFVGAGRHQRRAIARVQELGVRVVAVDANPAAPGREQADIFETVDFTDVAAVADIGRKHRVDGVMTFASDRSVPVVAGVAERLELPGIGSDLAHRATNKIAMRRVFREAGVPQPQFAVVRRLNDVRAAARRIGFPAVLKAADSAGQRGLFLVHSVDELRGQLELTLAASPSREALLESYHEGREVNTLLVARGGDVQLVTISDRIRPQGIGFGVALAHLYPSTLVAGALAEVERVAVASVEAIGLRNGIAYPQLLVSGSTVRVIEIAVRIPAGQMDEVPRIGVGIDLVEIAVRQALGEEVPDELLTPRECQPIAIRFLTAEPGPLPTGVVESVAPLESARASPGVVRVESWIRAGETIRPVQTDGDRRGYVIACGATNRVALERAEVAASLIHVFSAQLAHT